MRFKALRDFEATLAGRRSKYRAGLGYQARPEDEALRAMLSTWAEEGLVELVDEAKPAEGRMSGVIVTGRKRKGR